MSLKTRLSGPKNLRRASKVKVATFMTTRPSKNKLRGWAKTERKQDPKYKPRLASHHQHQHWHQSISYRIGKQRPSQEDPPTVPEIEFHDLSRISTMAFSCLRISSPISREKRRTTALLECRRCYMP